MRNDRDNLIVNETLQFSLQIIKYYELLGKMRNYVVSKQLLRLGT